MRYTLLAFYEWPISHTRGSRTIRQT